jgi:hypothetical protein
MNNKFKVDVVHDGKFKNGECRVVGSLPQSLPYVWIGDAERGCLAVLDARQMNMLAKRWAQANKARTRLSDSGRKLPAKKSNCKGSAPAKSG